MISFSSIWDCCFQNALLFATTIKQISLAKTVLIGMSQVELDTMLVTAIIRVAHLQLDFGDNHQLS